MVSPQYLWFVQPKTKTYFLYIVPKTAAKGPQRGQGQGPVLEKIFNLLYSNIKQTQQVQIHRKKGLHDNGQRLKQLAAGHYTI